MNALALLNADQITPPQFLLAVIENENKKGEKVHHVIYRTNHCHPLQPNAADIRILHVLQVRNQRG